MNYDLCSGTCLKKSGIYSVAMFHKKGHPLDVLFCGFRRPEAAFTLRCLKCSAEVNSASAKIFACGKNACTAQTRRPAVRGPIP